MKKTFMIIYKYIKMNSYYHHEVEMSHSSQTEPTKEEETYSRADLERLGKYFVNTDESKPEPESPSRIFEKSGHEVEDIDASLYKERWIDPNKHPKDLDNWGKISSQEYRPDIRFLQVNLNRSTSRFLLLRF